MGSGESSTLFFYRDMKDIYYLEIAVSYKKGKSIIKNQTYMEIRANLRSKVMYLNQELPFDIRLSIRAPTALRVFPEQLIIKMNLHELDDPTQWLVAEQQSCELGIPRSICPLPIYS